jgi:hypothetical protein
LFHGQEDPRKGIDTEGRVLEPLECGNYSILRETLVGIKNEGLVREDTCERAGCPHYWIQFGNWQGNGIPLREGGARLVLTYYKGEFGEFGTGS